MAIADYRGSFIPVEMAWSPSHEWSGDEDESR
jgi:hypothetical protein